MSSELSILYQGRRYILSSRIAAGKLPGARPLGRDHTARLLRGFLRDDTAGSVLRRAFPHVTGSALGPHGDEAVARALEARVLGRGTSAWVLLEQPGLLAGGDAPEVDEAVLRTDALLATLGREDLRHRGNGYRLVRASVQLRVAQREQYEVVSVGEAAKLLPELAGESAFSGAQRDALQALLSGAEARELPELVLLRRVRNFVRPVEEAQPATPSQLRQAQRHFVAVEVVDEDARAVLTQLGRHGIALDTIGNDLLRAGLTQFEQAHANLLALLA